LSGTQRPKAANREAVRAEVEVIYTIHYVDPKCPALAGLMLAFDGSQIPALKARLEHDGYVVTDVTPKTPVYQEIEI
jgi:hypothetical protein